jgi:hypothetical protein
VTLVGAKLCKCEDGWVWYSAGLKDGGYVCYLDTATYQCYEDLVYFDGTGLKRVYGVVAVYGENCPARTRVYYDGTGLRSMSTGTAPCT